MNEIVSTTPVMGMEKMVAPPNKISILGQIRRQVFGSPFSFVMTIIVAWLLFMILPVIVEWAFVKATWSAANGAECKRAAGGACWAFIAEKHRLILFGTYPYDEQWRPLVATIVLIALIAASCVRRFWSKKLLFVV